MADPIPTPAQRQAGFMLAISPAQAESIALALARAVAEERAALAWECEDHGEKVMLIDAPIQMGGDESSAWASGYSAACRAIAAAIRAREGHTRAQSTPTGAGGEGNG